MTIYHDDPPAFTAKLREALTILSDALRKKGAEVELIEGATRTTHVAMLAVTLRGSIREAAAVSVKLKRIGDRSGGVTYGTLLTPEKTGVPEGEYRVALAYQVSKPPRPRKRRSLTH